MDNKDKNRKEYASLGGGVTVPITDHDLVVWDRMCKAEGDKLRARK